MRTDKLAAIFFIFFTLAACAPAKVVAVKAPHAAVPAKKTAVPLRPSPANQKAIDQLYYQAVSAYTRNDLNAAGLYLGEIFKLDPAYAPAKELKEKIRLAVQKP